MGVVKSGASLFLPADILRLFRFFLFLDAGTLGESKFASFHIALRTQNLADHIRRTGIFRQQPRGFAEGFQGAIQIPFLLERGTEKIVRLPILRPLRHGGLHLLRGLLVIPQLPVRHAERVVRFGQIVIQADRFEELFFRALQIVLLLQRQTQIVMRDGRIVIDLQHVAELLFGLSIIPSLQVRETNIHHRVGIFSIALQHLFELFDGFHGLAQLHQREAVTVAYAQIGRIQFQRLRVGVARFGQRRRLLQRVAQRAPGGSVAGIGLHGGFQFGNGLRKVRNFIEREPQFQVIIGHARGEADSRLQQRNRLVRILRQPVEHAQVKCRGRIIRLQLQSALEVRFRFGRTVQHGQKEAALVFDFGGTRVGCGRFVHEGQRAGRIPATLQCLRLLTELCGGLPVRGEAKQRSNEENTTTHHPGPQYIGKNRTRYNIGHVLMHRSQAHRTAPLIALLTSLCASAQTPQYDLLLQGGRVIDAKNNLSAVRDVAILDGKIAAVETKIDPARALKTVNVAGLYVTPGIVDIHVHVYNGTGERGSYAGDLSVPPDGFTFRTGVTTVADAGCAGWRNFEDFKQRIIDRSKTRVLAFLNIVGNGMRGGKFESDLNDMETKPAAEMAQKYKDVIIGIKTAHFTGPEWTPVEHAVEAGTIANIPVMVDFGSDKPERPIGQLLTAKLRPGDIYTHCYSGLRHELDDSGKLNPALFQGRQRGVFFDVGQGGGSLAYPVAVEALKERFLPDSISTDLHTASMNSGTKDMLNLMSEFLALGLSLDDVVRRATWNPAREIHQESLGNLSVGAPADVAVLSLQTGKFGFADMYGARLKGTKRLQCELTLRAGKVVYDLNAISRPDWETLPKGYRNTADPRWDAVSPVRVRRPPTP